MTPWMAILAALAAVVAGCGIGYYVLCLIGAAVFRRSIRARACAQFAPPVSILKPLRGADPEIYQAFCSHCLQDYAADYELIFGVSDPEDPAILAVQRLQREFPERPIHLMVCREVLGTNMKVSNLIQMMEGARYQNIIVNDSDICVPPDYLQQVMRPFSEPEVGMVTCLYRGLAGNGGATLGAKLEALGISTEFHAGVLAARTLERGLHFALGSTLAFTRSALRAIGGFESLVDYLADDYELGRRIADAGFRVELSPVVVDTHLPSYSFAEFFNHQLRWARSTRHSRGLGWAGFVVTFALPWAALAVAASAGATWSWALLTVVAALRVAVALAVGRGILRDRQVLRDLWLLPLRDVVGLLVWACSYTGHTVAWRGDEFLLKNGKLLRKSPLAGFPAPVSNARAPTGN